MTRRYIGKIVSIALVFILAITSLYGCTQTTTPTPSADERYPVFYYALNSDATSMFRVEYACQSSSTEAKIAELVQLLMVNDKDNERYSVVPKNLRIEDWSLDADGNLTVSFNGEYSQMNAAREAVLRAGVVLTLTVVPDVKSVTFKVNGEPLTQHQEPVGPMTATMFANRIGEPTQVLNVKLYFVNSAKNGLVMVNRMVFPDDYEPMERYIVEYMIAGPTESEISSIKKNDPKPMAAIPSKTRINKVITKNTTCYVDLSSEFQNSDKTIPPKFILHSLADTLIRNIEYIDGVVFTVDGKKLSTYRGEEVPSVYRSADMLIQ